MLSPGRKSESLAARLLLSSALVAVSLAYGWWQRHNPPGPMMAMAAPHASVPAPARSATRAPAPAMASATPTASDMSVAAGPRDASRQAIAARAARESAVIARAAPPDAPAMPQANPQQDEAPLSSPQPAPLTAQAALQMNLPTDGVSPPLPSVSGMPAPGAAPSIPAGTHLQDGDYLSDKHEFEWGDLKVKISVHGGQITSVQILQYPDHRSQSLYLSQMAGPILESEAIKTQQSQVDAVSSATDTSYAFQDSIANAIVKATRG